MAADVLEQLFRDLYASGGMRGASNHSGRRSYVTRLVESGVSIEDVSRLQSIFQIETMVAINISMSGTKS